MNIPEIDYPYFGQHPWYAILLQDKFLSCFTDESYYLSTSGSKNDTFTELWKEFAAIIEGMTLACVICDSPIREIASESYFRMFPIQGTAIYHFLKTCPTDPSFFSKIGHTMDSYSPSFPEKLRPEQIAVLIFYPFWHRMGIDDEERFIRSGRLGHYLKLLKEKTVLPE